MTNNKLMVFLLFIVVVFVIYKASSGQPIIESWWHLSGAPLRHKVDRLICGQSASQNNQSSLVYNDNQIINPAFLNKRTANELGNQLQNISQGKSSSVGSISNQSSTLNSYDVLSGQQQELITQPNTSQQQPNQQQSNQQQPNQQKTMIKENFDSDNRYQLPVFQVPGTYQSDLSPRINPLGVNSYVKYNPPSEQNMANYPNDPLSRNVQENYDDTLSIAKMVEAPKIDKTNTVTELDHEKAREKLKQQGREVRDRLPVPNMNTVNCGDKKDVYYNADRYIFALQKSRLYSRADPIRGDIPITPCNPDKNPFSNTWFRPSVTPRYDLNAGALGVIAGPTNVTQQQLLELMSSSTSGSGPINGIEMGQVSSNLLNARLENAKSNEFQPYSNNNFATDTVSWASRA